MGEWGLDIAPETPCRELSVEQLQVVEIARALARGARCVVLDEPTAALEREASQRLFERVRQLTAAGVAVLYISHHLEEVFEICQDVAVLRDGELVLAAPTASLSKDDLVAAMVGGVATAAPPGTVSASPALPASTCCRRARCRQAQCPASTGAPAAGQGAALEADGPVPADGAPAAIARGDVVLAVDGLSSARRAGGWPACRCACARARSSASPGC